MHAGIDSEKSVFPFSSSEPNAKSCNRQTGSNQARKKYQKFSTQSQHISGMNIIIEHTKFFSVVLVFKRGGFKKPSSISVILSNQGTIAPPIVNIITATGGWYFIRANRNSLWRPIEDTAILNQLQSQEQLAKLQRRIGVWNIKDSLFRMDLNPLQESTFTWCWARPMTEPGLQFFFSASQLILQDD